MNVVLGFVFSTFIRKTFAWLNKRGLTDKEANKTANSAVDYNTTV